MKTYNIGPKLGDFIHGLVVPRYVYETTGEKAVIYISNEGCTFTRPIEETYQELSLLVKSQDFVEDFVIHKGEKVDYEIFRFRESPLLFKAGWTDIYFGMFLKGEKVPKDFQWLYLPVAQNIHTVVNRSVREMSPETADRYKALGEIDFIFSDLNQLTDFYRQGGPMGHAFNRSICKNLLHMCDKIAGCKLFVGNQSAPLAIASAFGKNRIAELRRGPDAAHYLEDIKNFSNLECFVGD